MPAAAPTAGQNRLLAAALAALVSPAYVPSCQSCHRGHAIEVPRGEPERAFWVAFEKAADTWRSNHEHRGRSEHTGTPYAHL